MIQNYIYESTQRNIHISIYKSFTKGLLILCNKLKTLLHKKLIRNYQEEDKTMTTNNNEKIFFRKNSFNYIIW